MALSTKTRPAATPREEVARITAEAIADADRLAAERAALEVRLAAVRRRRAELADLEDRTQARHDRAAQAATDAALLADLGMAPDRPDDDPADLARQLAALRAELGKADAAADDLQRRIGALAAREAERRAVAAAAPLRVLKAERAALVAVAMAHRVRYLLALREAGAWNKENDLLGVPADVAIRAAVAAIGRADVELGEQQVARLLAPYHLQDTRWLDTAAEGCGIGG